MEKNRWRSFFYLLFNLFGAIFCSLHRYLRTPPHYRIKEAYQTAKNE